MKDFVIDKFNASKKVFRFVQDVLPEMRNTEVFKLIRKEVIKVNGKKADSNHILKEGDKVSFFLADIHFKNKGKQDEKFQSVSAKLDVIFEDNDILVVNKPAGLLVHPDKKEFKNTLTEISKAYLYRKGEYKPNNFFAPSPTHRLDTNTSGLVVIAKNQTSLKNITQKFRDRETAKTYLALAFGKITNKILLTSFIDASENKENKVSVIDFKVLHVIPDKKEFLENNKTLCATLITPIKSATNCTLVEVDLWTGKKHQIRTHLQSNQNPLLGDNKYYTKASMSLSQMFDIKNYFLHSYKLQIEGYPLLKASVPKEFKKIVYDILKYEI
ncbi:MAG: hypothetical protein A2086_05560 [Spirochaetes bacterium GWD1_27_9]|nr:MAG: hypothetical protein A2Z98_16610 [Spirochaetes bacterium GWB1_27_13]OHD24316.1 MAG: hypothetical protein A2Y34_05245 [Spirochaetes bacterium GWC1_27_15]OHD37838.1 MAG: hypothetical protein A2086_05560 [Spirochaetes bacterium GWD1_27_9]